MCARACGQVALPNPLTLVWWDAGDGFIKNDGIVPGKDLIYFLKKRHFIGRS